MNKRRQCFVSVQGELLPRWREAFPSAIALKLGAKATATGQPTTVWIRLPARKAADVLAEVRQMFAEPVSCVVLSDMPNDDEAVDCFAAAARGYCNTHADPVLLRRIGKVVDEGGLWVGESLMQRLLTATAGLPVVETAVDTQPWEADLTAREREVARAVAAGASNKEIARQLGITERTVKAHTGSIFGKLGVRDRLQLSLRITGHRPA